MKFGSVLQACRERAGLSQEELAHQLNRTQSCVSKFEKDRKVPDIGTFMQWVQVTNAPEVAVAYLYGMDGINIIHQLLPMIGGLILGATIL
ncbi:helix-turn-helix transcriptional regulator [Peribacillus butanolivorans]|uniref:helix-turn-helix domain-containing protein n=1 Tax=Peribacillus butanolivorans TaxID=421767 RepID=UPI002E1EE1AE|nr:helix-turn-helix transcriptional regulator [Peribacillus butanolivorans]